MPAAIEAETLEFRDWVFRYRPAQGETARLLIMLHGWTGDENSMWFFARTIPGQVAILAPRAPFKAPEGGYTWRSITPGTWGYPSLGDLRRSAETFLDILQDWSHTVGLDSRQFDLVGFSQGAALSYAMTLLFPTRVRSLAALSGFIPVGADELFEPRNLEGKAVFVAHGRQDEMVPVEKAREAVKLLEKSGAQVTYCETDGVHKVSKECLGGLIAFINDQFDQDLG